MEIQNITSKLQKNKIKYDPDDYVGWHIKAMQMYKRDIAQKIIILALILLLGVSYHNIINTKDEVKVVIVRTDAVGKPIHVETAEGGERPPLREKEIRSILYHVLEMWRVRTIDVDNEKRKFRRVFDDFLRDAARQKFVTLINEGNLHPFVNVTKDKPYEPLEDVGNFTSRIKLNNITKGSDDLYNFRIWETIYDRAGREKATYPLLITFTIEQRRAESTKEVHSNPYGVYIVDLAGAVEKPNLENQ